MKVTIHLGPLYEGYNAFKGRTFRGFDGYYQFKDRVAELLFVLEKHYLEALVGDWETIREEYIRILQAMPIDYVPNSTMFQLEVEGPASDEDVALTIKE